MIRKMRSEDKKTYMEMAREFYHSDAVLHPVPDTYFERTADEALRSDVYAEIFLFECENEAAADRENLFSGSGRNGLVD